MTDVMPNAERSERTRRILFNSKGLLWALNFEAGIYIANADDDATRKDMVSTLERVLAGLRPRP